MPREPEPEGKRISATVAIFNCDVPVWLLLRSTVVGFSVHEICTLVLLAAQVRSTVVANPLSAVTVTVDVPVCPELTFDTAPSMAKSAAGDVASQAVIRFETLTDPSPVTWS